MCAILSTKNKVDPCAKRRVTARINLVALIMNIFAAVSDKSLLDPLLAVLDKKDTKFWGTERTVKYLKSKGFSAKSVVSGFDFDGRVKTLDKSVFARILADRFNLKHLKELKELNLTPFDLVVVDLYPPDKKIFPESMDIGGVSLIRAAIKNYKNVALAFDKKSLLGLAAQLKASRGSTSLAFRKTQAKSALKFVLQCVALETEYGL